jgi:serine/threonine protein phosphatase 1
MKYVMSDLHGRYDKYTEMLSKIHFTNDDELYILGDICDRGPASAQIYLEIMGRENVHCVMGNHENMLLENLPLIFRFLFDKDAKLISADYELWSVNGGGTTCASFVEVGKEKMLEIYNLIRLFPLYRVIEVETKRYLLVHAGIDNYNDSKSLSEYLPEELLWSDIDYDDTYYPIKFDKIIVGHTPTFLLNENKSAAIYHGKGNVIAIDCGAVFEKDGGRLGCLCLDTMQEFYV